MQFAAKSFLQGEAELFDAEERVYEDSATEDVVCSEAESAVAGQFRGVFKQQHFRTIQACCGRILQQVHD